MCSLFLFRAPPTALLPKLRYERIIEAFGAKGFFAETPDELKTVLESAFEETRKIKKPVLINVMISPYADRKPQVLKLSLVQAFDFVISSTLFPFSRLPQPHPTPKPTERLQQVFCLFYSVYFGYTVTLFNFFVVMPDTNQTM